MISFNNIPENLRTPGTYAEVDNSRALKGLFPNPQKVLLIGQRTTEGSKQPLTLTQITSDGLADGFFGPGSQLAIMCNVFKQNNANTEVYAIALSDVSSAVKASGAISFSAALSATGGSCSGTGRLYLMIDGIKRYTTMTSGWSAVDCNSAVKDNCDALTTLPVKASVNSGSILTLVARNAGSCGNDIDIRCNYYAGQSYPVCFTDSVVITAMAGGSVNASLDDAWAVAPDVQYHYIGHPYDDEDNLTSIENFLADRYGPMIDLQGQGFTAHRGSLSSNSTLGNSRNSPHQCIMGAYGSPSSPTRWAAALTAIAAYYLNDDPARPLHYLALKGILAPAESDRFSQSERNILLYDGIATWIVDSSDNVCIERCITTYQTNAAGVEDPSYLDVQTLATLSEIRYQYKARMLSRFIIPRFKLVDDSFPIQPGTYVTQPKSIKDEIVALFSTLQDKGLIENLADFVTNLRVERDSTDVNRVNVLLPPDLVNQFMVLASIIQFIL